MTDTTTKNGVCSACGVEVRQNAGFCFNCGEEVSLQGNSDASSDEISDAWLRGNIQGEEDGKREITSKESSEKKDFENVSEKLDDFDSDNGVPENEIDTSKTEGKVKVNSKTEAEESEDDSKKDDKAKLKTAASLRKQNRRLKPNQIEVVWEEYEKAPNAFLLLIAIGVVLGVLGMFYLAMYLK